MVVCNICGKNKPLITDNWKHEFRYVCLECWDKMNIYIDNVEIDKELMY